VEEEGCVATVVHDEGIETWFRFHITTILMTFLQKTRTFFVTRFAIFECNVEIGLGKVIQQGMQSKIINQQLKVQIYCLKIIIST